MYPTTYLLRIAKLVAVLALGIMAFLIVIDNTTDYYTNYHFVEHVMKMDTIFPQSAIHYRNIHNPVLFHVAYIFIIIMEFMMSVCCLRGSWLLFRHLKADAVIFHHAKNWSVAGIIIGIIVWFFGFEVIGGEWFGMWQSPTWNGLAGAERIVTFLLLTLILLQLKEEPLQNQVRSANPN
jgi:predicted small integral membrane protein